MQDVCDSSNVPVTTLKRSTALYPLLLLRVTPNVHIYLFRVMVSMMISETIYQSVKSAYTCTSLWFLESSTSLTL